MSKSKSSSKNSSGILECILLNVEENWSMVLFGLVMCAILQGIVLLMNIIMLDSTKHGDKFRLQYLSISLLLRSASEIMFFASEGTTQWIALCILASEVSICCVQLLTVLDEFLSIIAPEKRSAFIYLTFNRTGIILSMLASLVVAISSMNQSDLAEFVNRVQTIIMITEVLKYLMEVFKLVYGMQISSKQRLLGRLWL